MGIHTIDSTTWDGINNSFHENEVENYDILGSGNQILCGTNTAGLSSTTWERFCEPLLDSLNIHAPRYKREAVEGSEAQGLEVALLGSLQN